MKKRQYYIVILTVCSMVLLVGCGKNNSKNNNSKNNNSYNNHSNYTPSTTPAQTAATLALEDAPTVSLNNLVITAGSEIDYMSAIESVENMDLSKSMVSINSSNVDRFTPGSYTVYYTFDYMGHTVKSFIVVTVLENIEETTVPAETTEEIHTEENSAANVSEQTSSAENSNEETSNEENQTPNGETSSELSTESTSGQNEENTSSSENTNGALNATVYHPDLPIPDAVFTLSTGETVTIKNTPERYIVETFTDDVYYTEDGCSYLRSELKVLMNTGEVQTVEMVVTRVNTLPEEISPN